jgi:PleD family two-component response regulator
MIVVVDDVVDAAEVLVKLLKKTGYDAVAKTSGEDLLRYLETDTPRLIILDLHMPRIDGMECLRLMRADARWAKIPVIMYSADFHHDRMKEAERLGVRDYVVKGTMRWGDFAEIIHRTLKAA